MKHINCLNLKSCVVTLLLAAGLFSACSEELIVGQVNENDYTPADGAVVAYVSDQYGKRMFSNVDFRSAGSVALRLKTAVKPAKESTVAAVYDETVLTEYNGKYGTTYEAFPKSAVTLEADGMLKLPAGSLESGEMKVSYTSDGQLSPTKTYVIPLRFKVTAGDCRLSTEDQTRIILVKDLTGIPDCAKFFEGKPSVKVFSCMEVNDTNPLNNLSFTLKSNGKPLVDALIMFSANINYNAETGRVYVFCNENVRALLEKRAHYLKPLQDRGMKIILGLLGNHDRSGVSNMAKETAQAFAQDVKAICDAYNLDGVFLDDEYSNYETSNITPGFVSPGGAAAARLCYELKKAQPERLVTVYAYSTTYGLPAVDGVRSGEFVDYGLHDYGGYNDLSQAYPGMPKSNMGLHSQEFNHGRFADESSLKKMREDGYLSHMIFAMDPYRRNFTSGQLPAMQRMARAFYNEELVFDGMKYPKDWK